MKKYCKSLREYAMQIISFKRKKMKLLTNECQGSYENTKICYVCKETLKINIQKTKHLKVRDD